MDAVFRALADPGRRRLLDRLAVDDGLTLGELCAVLPAMTRFGVMKHLHVLEEAGLVTTERHGRHKRHHLDRVPIRQVHDRWISRFDEPLVRALARLQADLTPAPFVHQVAIVGDPVDVWAALTGEVDGGWLGWRVAVGPTRWRVDEPDGTPIATGGVLARDRPERLVLGAGEHGRLEWVLTVLAPSVTGLTCTGPAGDPLVERWPLVASAIKSLVETGRGLVLAA